MDDNRAKTPASYIRRDLTVMQIMNLISIRSLPSLCTTTTGTTCPKPRYYFKTRSRDVQARACMDEADVPGILQRFFWLGFVRKIYLGSRVGDQFCDFANCDCDTLRACVLVDRLGYEIGI